MFSNSKKDKNEIKTNSPITTVIGPEITFTGDIVGSQTIKIDGNIIGNVNVDKRVILGQKGYIQGNIKSSIIEIFGKVDGNVECNELVLNNTGKIKGDISTDNIEIQRGGVYNGQLKMTENKVTQTPINEPKQTK